MKPPKRASGTVSMKKAVKAYKKGVKTKTETVAVQNYQTGTNPKMDRLVNQRMGEKVAPGASYTGPLKSTKTTIKYKPKPMRTVASGTTGSGSVRKTIKKGRSL